MTKKILKGTLFLLLKNAPNLSDKQSDKLDDLLESNKTLCAIYMLKEQLQALWGERTFDLMIAELDSWCQLAKRRGSYLSSTLQTRFRREDLGSAIMQTIG